MKPGTDIEAASVRFEAERQALTMMEHPAIARVHDADLTQGSPTFRIVPQ